MEVKHGTHVYLGVSITIIKKMASGTLSYNYILLHFSNLYTIKWMEVKPGTPVLQGYFSNTHTPFNTRRWNLVHSVPMETMKKNASGTFPYKCFLLLKLANHTGEICTHVYLSICIISTSPGIFYRGLPPTQLFTLSVYTNERRQVIRRRHIGIV